ncbi:DUF4249 family protein [Sporocytophaga myxococcoides]|uniref:DUF4249 family protein n=1 Tax=Sporocytophaga myxococcoides TaxID=153721 RepID=UPI000416DBEA|nr:DUF4249 family protein [Sporocytophaga myxococcoides]
MIRFYLNIFLILISIPFLTSCIKEADEVKVSTSMKDMKIVVRGFVSPIEAKVAISQTLPFFNKNGYSFEEQYITDAKVTVSDGKDTVRLFHQNLNDNEISFYGHTSISPFDFRPGQKLYLNVDLPDGRHVDAITTVPDTIDVIITKSDSIFIDHHWIYGYNCFNRSSNSKYILGVYDYYTRCYVRVKSWNDTVRDYSKQSILFMEYIPSNQSATMDYYYNKNSAEQIYYITYDYLRLFSFNEKLKGYNFSNSLSERPVSVEPLYSYDSTDFSKEPLFTEPIYYDYYSNINGGLGFFEAYQEKIVKLR